MSKTIRKSQPDVAKDMTKRQMEYYMGAKLIEVGVNPNSAIYRWSVEIKGNNEIWDLQRLLGRFQRATAKTGAGIARQLVTLLSYMTTTHKWRAA
jgi:hypothetical protein